MRTRFLTFLILTLTVVGTAAAPVAALQATGAAANTLAANQANQIALNHLKSRGNAEITRRLITLSKLDSVISSTTKLSAANKTDLSDQVSAATSGLKTLKSQLAAETDITAARTDAQSIIDNYRVYALLVPKVYLLKTSDSELVNDGKLSSLAAKLQARITSAQTAGKNVAALQASLKDMNSQITAAKTIENAVNTKMEPLQPSDYNTDHTLLEGQRDQLKTAHTANQAAYNDAKSIVTGLK